MSERSSSSDGPRRRRLFRRGDALDVVLQAMREEHEGGVSPDVAGSVMSRLGYAPVSAAEARRERLSRLAWRVASTASVLCLAGLVVWGVHTSRVTDGREHSVEEVVRTSLEQKSRLLGGVAKSLQPLGEGFSLPPAVDEEAVNEPQIPHVPPPSSDGKAPALAPVKKV